MPLPTKVNVSRPEAWGYDALIEYGPNAADSLYLRLAVGPGRQMSFRTAELEEGSPRTATNPEDMRVESGESFSRSDFTGGEGLDRAHRRDGLDRDFTRFWDSRNIDITPARAGVAEEIKLLHSASNIRADDPTNVRMPLVRVGNVLYGVISNDALVDRTNNPTAGTPNFTTADPGGTGSIQDLAALGDEVYAARNNIRKRNPAGSWAQWSDLDASRLWSAKGRIIASSETGDALYEARAGAGSLLLHTLASGEIWNDVVDAGGAILAAASDGYIYSFAEQNGELALKGQTQIEGENPTALGFAQGLVFIGTAQATTGGGNIGRLWQAILVGLRLREAQVIRQWGDGSTTTDRAPRRIISTREAVWTSVIEDGTETHLWRFHLTTGGLVRDLILGASGVTHGLAEFDDRLFATVFGDGLWREDTTYATSGYLIGPLADFYNAGKKAWVGARLTTGTVPTGTQVDLDYSTDPSAIEDNTDPSWTTIITAIPATPGDSSETAITGVESRYLAAKLVLTPDGGNTATPTVLAYAFRGTFSHDEDDYAIPVNISDRLEMPHRKPQTISGVGDAMYEKLQELRGQAVTVTLLRPDEQIKGQFRTLSAPIEEIPDRGSPTVYALAVFRGIRQ